MEEISSVTGYMHFQIGESGATCIKLADGNPSYINVKGSLTAPEFSNLLPVLERGHGEERKHTLRPA